MKIFWNYESQKWNLIECDNIPLENRQYVMGEFFSPKTIKYHFNEIFKILKFRIKIKLKRVLIFKNQI